MGQLKQKNIYWILKDPAADRYIAYTGGDWGPSALPQHDPTTAIRFKTQADALNWAREPGHGWNNYIAIRILVEIIFEILP